MGLTIREAAESDINEIYGLILAIARHHDQEKYVITDKSKLLDAGFGPDPKFKVLLAEVDHSVSGFLSYTLEYSIWLGSTYLHIDDIYVKEEFRGQKVGEALMNKIREICSQLQITKVKWEVENGNQGAIRFYERLGATLKQKGLFSWNV